MSDPLAGLAEAVLAARRPDLLAGMDVAVATDLPRAAAALTAAGARVTRRRPAWQPLDCLLAHVPPTRSEHRWVAVLGAVTVPIVTQVPAAGLRVEDLLPMAGGYAGAATVEPEWLAGGALRHRPVDGWMDAAAACVYLVLPPGHGLVRRARRPLEDARRAARSRCQGCDLCSAACTAGVAPHLALRALVTGKPLLAANGRMNACDGCGLCSTACPAGLEPHRLVSEQLSRRPPRSEATLPSAGPPVPSGRIPGRRALLARLGLAAYAGQTPKFRE